MAIYYNIEYVNTVWIEVDDPGATGPWTFGLVCFQSGCPQAEVPGDLRPTCKPDSNSHGLSGMYVFRDDYSPDCPEEYLLNLFFDNGSLCSDDVEDWFFTLRHEPGWTDAIPEGCGLDRMTLWLEAHSFRRTRFWE